MDGLLVALLLVALVVEGLRLIVSPKARRQYVAGAFQGWEAGCNDRKVLARSPWLPQPILLRWIGAAWVAGCALVGLILAPWLVLLGLGFGTLAYLLDVWLHRAAQLMLRRQDDNANGVKPPCQ